ncbi:hypothetical protein ABW21_db0209347 [Orbilia brochopaga]|nr:hypothetical protein ABW21_db0209347 [Drechslerella brochopaga]
MALTNPFEPARNKATTDYLTCLNSLDGLVNMTLDDRLVIRAVLSYTTNEELLHRFASFSLDELNDLRNLSLKGLTNLRGRGGQKGSTTTSPTSSKTGSRASSPGPSRTPESPLWSNLFKKTLIRGLPPQVPESLIGASVVSALGLNDSTDLLESINKARSASFGATATARQQNFCLITATDLSQIAETAHLFPHSALLNKESQITWRFLAVFLGQDILGELASEIDPNKQCFLNENGVLEYDLLKEYRALDSGTSLRIATPDPITLPLPSVMLLYWHGSIWKLIAAAGLGETAASKDSERTGGTRTPRIVHKRKYDDDEDQDKPEDPPEGDPADEDPPPGEDPPQPGPSSTRKSARIASKAGQGRKHGYSQHQTADYSALENSVRDWARKCLSEDMLEAYGVQY